MTVARTVEAAPPARYEPPLNAALGRLAAVLLLGACALVPFTTFRLHPDYLFTVSDALFTAAAILLLGGQRLNLRPFGGLTILWIAGIVAMLLGFLVGSLVHGDPLRWLIVAAQYSFAFVLLPTLLVRGNRESSIRLARALLFGVVAMEAFGVFVYYVIHPSYALSQRISPEFITGGHRLGAFMADANWNAAMVATTMPFVFYLSRTGRLGAIGTYGSIAILGWGLMLSGSFTGFTSMAIATLIFLLVSGGTRAIRTAIGLIALGTGLTLSGVTPPSVFESRVQEALEEGDLSRAGTFTGRMELIKEAWGIVNDTTFVGLGVDQYRVVSKDKAPVHNMFLLVWAEGGLIALLGWLGVLAVPVMVSASAFRRERVAAALGFSVLAPFVAFSIAAPHMYSRSWVVPLIIAMAVILARRSRIPTRFDDPEGVRVTTKAPPPSRPKSRILAA